MSHARFRTGQEFGHVLPSSSEARSAALFASDLQPSDAPTAAMVDAAIKTAISRLGVAGCVCRMAQEFGDHPEAASGRMGWALTYTSAHASGVDGS